MKFSSRPRRATILAILGLLPWIACAVSQAALTTTSIPEPLKAWEGWAVWADKHRDCPTPYQDSGKHLCFWPSRLELQIDKTAGRLSLGVTVYHETWVPLPGDKDLWPLEIKANGTPTPVVEHDGKPSVQLAAGTYRIEGSYHWNEIPQRISMPHEIGVLALTLDGKPVDAPVWDAQGFLWLKRDGSSTETDKDFLAVKVYAVLEDGIPLWLRTKVELIVSGKSREEQIGCILPEGWKLAAVESSIPVAVDDQGRLKAQVRAGRWTLTASAFRSDDLKEFRYAPSEKPAVKEELVAFRSLPDFRMIEIVGVPSIDVSQTTFPGEWRELPVYRWDTASSFRIEERMRGMGLQKPAGLKIKRELWLDENGRGFTFLDMITGQMQQIWRLDAAEGENLGSVRSSGQGQLITRNPKNGAPGVELRTRNINLEATGRVERSKALSATGWRADADGLDVTLNLPPGWRLFAFFGADRVSGDWLTAWSLLDLFVLLVFSLAVFRLWGFGPGILAFLAFGLSYHEAGAPRYVWLALLVPLALLRVVVAEGWGRRLLSIWKWVTVAVFILVLVPFIASQVQQAIYPQLEAVGMHGSLFGTVVFSAYEPEPRDFEPAPAMMAPPMPAAEINAPADQIARKDSYSFGSAVMSSAAVRGTPQWKSNLAYDTKARIQTGPGVPDWKWRSVSFGWNGPVTASQQVHPILISLPVERVLTVLRIVLLLALSAVLLNARALRGSSFFKGARQAMVLILCALWTWGAASAQAQMPDEAMLKTLRERLLEPSDAYPYAADIPSVSLTLTERRIVMDAEIDAAIRTAVPLPGRLPTWSPLSVTVDGKPEVALRREDGYLWVVLSAGVHRVRVEGLLANVTEWEWTFQLKPHRVTIEAPGWTFSGVRPDGIPEQQIFFALKQKSVAGEASYDRQDYQTVAEVERNLELGLIWQLHTTVKRLSPDGKAVALRIPLIPGENVVSSNAVIKDGFIEVRLGAHESSFGWESELPVADHLKLATKAADSWVERWRLVASPVWNVSLTGLTPTFEPANPDLVPVWRPWPGESVELGISRPEAIPGATITVSNATHDITLGKRQRVSKLGLSLKCSLGEDFAVDLPADAEITSLNHNNKAIPVRKDGTKVIIPLRPGEQPVSIEWKTNVLLGARVRAEAVRLPVESANVKTSIHVADDRWVLLARGPQCGPAVRFWGILVCCLIAAGILGRMTLSPLRSIEWMLLAVGLTQVPLPAALAVIAWLFLLAWRGQESVSRLSAAGHNLLQILLIILTMIVLGIFIAVVGAGLLGNPEMFITGNDSTRSMLQWYQARCDGLLPQPGCISISIWWYRFLMLAWALWLAASLIRWLRWAWQQFSTGGCFRQASKKKTAIPPLPTAR